MLISDNKEWGFWGTACQQGGKTFAEEAWKLAFQHVDNSMGWGEEMTRDFLDSRLGRHYADQMAGKNWQDAITKAYDMEYNCRAFFKEVNPQNYKMWCRANGNTPTERTLNATGIGRQTIHKAVNTLTGLEYNQSQIDECIRRAGPLAKTLALLLAELPEEILEIYTAN